MYEDIVDYSEISPSGLVWKTDRYCLKHKKRLIAKAGDFVGTKKFRDKLKLKPKCWYVRLKGKQ